MFVARATPAGIRVVRRPVSRGCATADRFDTLGSLPVQTTRTIPTPSHEPRRPMTYLYIGLAVSGGAIIQGAIGFAFGIFAIPLLVLIGLPLEQAIALVLALVLVQTLASVWQNPISIPWPEILAISVPRFLAVVVGVSTLHYIRATWSVSQIKQLMGGCLLAIIAAQLWIRPRPRPRLGWGWTWLAGILSGLLAGLIGMGGPPVVLWVVAHDWSSHKSRACMWCAFCLMVPWQLAVLYQRFGMPVVQSAAVGIAYMPLVFLATLWGTRLGNRMSQAWLRILAFTLLAGMGACCLLEPWLSG